MEPYDSVLLLAERHRTRRQLRPTPTPLSPRWKHRMWNSTQGRYYFDYGGHNPEICRRMRASFLVASMA